MSEELKFTTDGQDRTPDWSRFELMRLSRDCVWVNPDLKPDEAAQAVLNALDANIRVLVQRAVETEREECARAAETLALDDYGSTDDWPDAIAIAIRSRT